MTRDGGSYRDPNGYVFYSGGRVFRAVMERARPQYDHVRQNGLVSDLVAEGALVGSRELGAEESARLAPDAAYVVEHDVLPFISYPFEWPFALLKRAALFHLELHARLLDAGLTLSDATAYNVQFRGPRPVFIDLLSLREYRDGELWAGHHQFMQQFAHPLLLNALGKVSYNAWYRGTTDGIGRQDLLRCLPLRKRLSGRVLRNVSLPQLLEDEYRSSSARKKEAPAPARLEKRAFLSILDDLRQWIEGLCPGTARATVWSDYGSTRTYTADEVREKQRFVAEFARDFEPEVLWDIGCNTGEFSETALANGCRRSIGFDLDEGALEAACRRAVEQDLDFLPLRMDLLNPTPACGWRTHERQSLFERPRPDAILALALVHHLAIGGNVPLADAVAWLVSLAPAGVIEFVSKEDTTVGDMLRLREDVFDDYSEDTFRRSLEKHAEVVRVLDLPSTGRRIFAYRR